MPVRDGGNAALTAGRAAEPPRHFGGRTTLIEADQTAWVQMAHQVAPTLALDGDVGSLPLARMRCLFFSVIWWWSKKRHSASMLTRTPRASSSARSSLSVM